jgi:hypothetical protein
VDSVINGLRNLRDEREGIAQMVLFPMALRANSKANRFIGSTR